MVKPTFSIAPVAHAHQENELYFHLYLHHTYRGQNPNQSDLVNPQLPNAFGWTAVNDWPMYDGVGPDTKVIARAQGLHIQAGMTSPKWYNSFSIVFEDDRFKGSTLQVMGPVVENGEWAIVGGTGEFSLARGIVNKKTVEQQSHRDIIELAIHALYSPVRKYCWTLGN